MANPNPTYSFPKGVSGNPGGRPKKEWTWSGLLEEAMEEELTTVDGKTDKVKKFITKRLVKMAIDGDLSAQKEIMNRMEGMPKQSMELSGNEESPIKVDVIETLKKIYGRGSKTSTKGMSKDSV